MRRLLLCALVTACYAPHLQEGAPCDDMMPCPSEQSCVAGFCRFGGTPTDGHGRDGLGIDGPPGDRDNDGVADEIDNCPDVANPDQANEDGDKFGDACDPCPIDKNDTPSDPDHDGVADPCDPNPNTPGDSILLFEGFHKGVPATWQVIGQVTQVGEDIEAAPAAGNHTALIPPVAIVQKMTVTTLLVIESSTVGNNLDSWVSIGEPYDPGTDGGIFCEIYNPASNTGNPKDIDIFDTIANTQKGQNNFGWALNTPYTLVATKNGNNYTCNAVGQKSTSGSTNNTPPTQKLALHNFSSAVKYSWLMVVTSP